MMFVFYFPGKSLRFPTFIWVHQFCVGDTLLEEGLVEFWQMNRPIIQQEWSGHHGNCWSIHISYLHESCLSLIWWCPFGIFHQNWRVLITPEAEVRYDQKCPWDRQPSNGAFTTLVTNTSSPLWIKTVCFLQPAYRSADCSVVHGIASQCRFISRDSQTIDIWSVKTVRLTGLHTWLFKGINSSFSLSIEIFPFNLSRTWIVLFKLFDNWAM